MFFDFDDPESVLLVDLNNLLFRTLYVREIGIQTEMPDFKLWRYLTFESIFHCIKKFDITEVILAVDDKISWRRSFFPRYKESRKKQRDKQGIDFSIVFGVINKYLADLKHSMPFKIIKVRSAEADDVIAVLANELDNCIISSNDEDFLQLVGDTKLWNPSRQEFSEFPINLNKKDNPVMCETPEEFLKYKILMGQAKDGIFNIKTPNDWGQTVETQDKRKPPFGPKSAEKVIRAGASEWVTENNLDDHWHRNEVLIDFKKIPNIIISRIADAYNNYNFPPPDNMYPFFKRHDMRFFLENFEFAEPKLMRLY